MFEDYIKSPTTSHILNTKVILLSTGLDVDFNRLTEYFPNLPEEYRNVSHRATVSDRANIDPKSEKRLYIPDELILQEDGRQSVVKVYYEAESPLRLSAGSNGLVIEDKDTGVLVPMKVLPIRTPIYTNKRFEDGSTYDKYVSLLGTDRVSVIPYDGCECWMELRPCSFCGGNPKRLGFDGSKPNLAQAIKEYGSDYRRWWNDSRDEMRHKTTTSMSSLLATDYPEPHFHFMVIGGNLSDLDYEWNIIFDLLDPLRQVVEFDKIDSCVNMMPPNDLMIINRLQGEFGFTGVGFNLEVWGEKDFKEVCPGKQILYGWENMIKALDYSARVFEHGKTRTNFVLGAQDVKKTVEGSKQLASMGIVPDYSVFFPRPASKWSKKSAPTPDEILEFGLEMEKIYREYEFDPVYCSLSSRSSIASEIRDLNV